MRHTLDGSWRLSFTSPINGEKTETYVSVPNNVETALTELGLIEEPMPADSYKATADFDLVDDWTYTRLFDAPPLDDGYTRELVFDGIDTVAEIRLNGEKLLDVANMHRQWRISVTDKLLPKDNELRVVIRSADRYVRRKVDGVFPLCRNDTMYSSFSHIRKARHCWGWDNAPRLLTSGIFRSVYLEDKPPEYFREVYLHTLSIEDGVARIGIHWDYAMPEDKPTKDYTIRYTVSYNGNTVYTREEEVFFPRGALRPRLPLDKIKLWYPYGMGSPERCDVTLEMLCRGETVSRWHSKLGVRTVRVIESDEVDEKGNGEFLFVVNGERVLIRGTNWKPAHALHSLADKKALEILPLAKECNCNMIRIWGGGIYEDDAFFDYCDENGILVWQDFMFACEMPANNDEYCAEVAKEAEYIVRKLRNHCSLAIWCGDNEVDNFLFDSLTRNSEFLPSDRRISRDVLRKAVIYNDPYRHYTGSSPRYSDKLVIARRNRDRSLASTETHLYTTNEFSVELRKSRACFIGETGPICFNAMTDSESIFAREESRCRRLWDAVDVPYPMVDVHQSDSYFARWRIFGRERCMEWFGRDFSLDEWKDYCIALNTVCADIFKDVIEYSRVMRWRKSGVLWWSLCDMWPMLFNYSVIDSELRPKLPFYWIKQSQRDLALMIVRKETDGAPELYVANDTLDEKNGKYEIFAYDINGNERTVMSGSYSALPNSVTSLDCHKFTDSQELWLIRWSDSDGEWNSNHFASGKRPYPFEAWRIWNGILAKEYGAEKDL